MNCTETARIPAEKANLPGSGWLAPGQGSWCEITAHRATYSFSAPAHLVHGQHTRAASNAKKPLRKRASNPLILKRGEKERLHVEDRTTNVNATGLPTDITVEAFIQLLTWHDYEIPGQNLWSSFTKINHRNLKADGLCSYLKRDSGLCNNAFG